MRIFPSPLPQPLRQSPHRRWFRKGCTERKVKFPFSIVSPRATKVEIIHQKSYLVFSWLIWEEEVLHIFCCLRSPAFKASNAASAFALDNLHCSIALRWTGSLGSKILMSIVQMKFCSHQSSASLKVLWPFLLSHVHHLPRSLLFDGSIFVNCLILFNKFCLLCLRVFESLHGLYWRMIKNHLLVFPQVGSKANLFP